VQQAAAQPAVIWSSRCLYVRRYGRWEEIPAASWCENGRSRSACPQGNLHGLTEVLRWSVWDWR